MSCHTSNESLSVTVQVNYSNVDASHKPCLDVQLELFFDIMRLLYLHFN